MTDTDNLAKRRGRRPLPREEARSHRVVSFVTEPQFIELERIANKQSVTVSALIHNITTTYLDKEK